MSQIEFERLSRGDEFERTVALATSLGNPELFDQDLVARGVLRSDSANEQFYTLSVAEAMWDLLDSAHQNKVLRCITRDDRAGRRIRGGSSRNAVTDRIQAVAGHSSSVVR